MFIRRLLGNFCPSVASSSCWFAYSSSRLKETVSWRSSTRKKFLTRLSNSTGFGKVSRSAGVASRCWSKSRRSNLYIPSSHFLALVQAFRASIAASVPFLLRLRRTTSFSWTAAKALYFRSTDSSAARWRSASSAT